MNLQEIIAKNKEVLGGSIVRDVILCKTFIGSNPKRDYGNRTYEQVLSVSIGLDSRGLLIEEAIERYNKNKLPANVKQIVTVDYARNWSEEIGPVVAIKTDTFFEKPLTKEVQHILRESMRQYNESNGFFEQQ